jgi:Cu2+-exporting ATPase
MMTLAVQSDASKTEVVVGLTYYVVHAIPGRVRFRVPLLAHDSNYAQRLQTLLNSDSRVTKIRVNKHAASVAIQYQQTGSSDSLMRAYLGRLIEKALMKGQGRLGGAVTQKGGETGQEFSASPRFNVFASSSLPTPFLAAFLAVLGLRFPILKPLVATTVGVAAFPVAKRALKSVTQQRKLNIDCLDFIAIALSSAQGNLLTPALVMTLHEIGDRIRDRTSKVSRDRTSDLVDSLAHYAWVEQPDGEKKQILATQVQLGDTVIVYPGEQIPVDGKVLRGTALIDQQKLTGESLPVVRETGQMVYASTLVREGQIYILAERVGNATRASASIELIAQAPVHDTRMENYAASVADKAIVPALLFSGAVLAVTRNPARAAAILTLDFVTGIRVSLPTTFLAALHHAARHGVLIRSGRALEKLSQVNTLVFDKTGTLTQGNVAVVDVQAVPGRLPADRVLELAAAAEQRLTHPVAAAVMHYAQQQNVEILPRGEWEYEIGLGVRADIQGEEVLVGSKRFLHQYGIAVDCLYGANSCRDVDCHHHQNCHISAHAALLYVAVRGEFQGVIHYQDPLRQESPAVIQQLQSLYGMEIHLLTGDNQHRATSVAQELGIPLCNVHSQAFPERKAEIVRRLHDSGKTVAFTGDGLNDSVALAYADVSISFGDGSEVARETADVVLMNNNLTSFVEAIAIAKQTKQVIEQNIGLSVLPNLAALGVASTVGLHPLAATVVHNGSAIAAGLNGLRPLMHQDPPPKVVD